MPTGPRPRGSSCSAASAAGVASFPRTSTAATAAAAGAKRGHPQEKHVSKRCTPLTPAAGRSSRVGVANVAAQGVSNLAARSPSVRHTAAAGGAHADSTEPAGRPRSNTEGGPAIETETEQPESTLERRTVSGTANSPKIHQSLSKSARWDFLPRLRKANSNTTRTSTTKSSRDKTAAPNSASTPSNAVENFPAHGALPSEVSYPVEAPPTGTGTPSSRKTSSTVLPRSSHISSKLFGTAPHTAPAAGLLPRRGRGPSTEKQQPVVTSSSRPHLSSPASPAAAAAACRQTVDRASSSCSRVPGQEGQSDDIFGAAPASMPAPAAKSQFPAFAAAAAAACPSAGGCVGNLPAAVALPASSAEGLLAGAGCDLSRAPASTQESLGPPSSSVTISGNQAPSQLANRGSPSAAAASPSSQPQGRRPQRPAAPAPAAAASCTSLFLQDSDVAAGSQTPACGTRRRPAPSSGAAASCAVPPAATAAAVPPPPISVARGARTSPSCIFLDDRSAASSAADPIAALPAAAAALSAAAPARSFADVRHARLSNGSACLTHLRWWLRRRLRLASSGLLHKNVMNHPHVLAAARIAPLQTAAAAGNEALEAAPTTAARSASARAAQREGGGPSCAAISSAAEAAAALAAGCSPASAAAAAATTSAAGATGAAASFAFTPHSVEAVAVQLAHKLICCLLLKEKSSVLLLGPPGSGKTAAVSLALRTVQQLAQQQRNQRAQQHRDAQQVPKEHPEPHEAHTHETSPWTGQLQQQQGGGELSAPARPDEGSRETAAPCGRAAPSSGAGGAEVAAATAAGPSSSVNGLLCAGGPRGAACAVFTEAFPASPLRCSRPLVSAAVAAVGAAEPSGAVCEVAAGCASSAGAAGALSAADSKSTPRSGKKPGVRSAGAVGRKGVVGRGGTGGGGGERNERILTATQQQQLLPDLLVVHVCCSLYPDETAMLHTIVQQLAQALHCQQLPPASASFEELCNTLRLILGDSCSVFHRAVVIVLDHFEVCCFAAEAAGAAAGGGRCWGAGAAWNGMQVPTPQVHGTGHSARRQQLLYCLFDLQHSSKLQLCTVCVSSVLDITEVMEKRIRSRFSLQTLYVSGSGTASALLHFVRQQLLHLSPQQLLRIATDAAAAEQVYVDWLDHAAAPAAGLAAAAEGRMEQHEKLAEGGGRPEEEEEGRRRGEMVDSDTAAESDEEQGRVAGREEQQQHLKEGKEIGTQQKKPRRDRAQVQEEKKNRRNDTEAEAERDTETAGQKGKPLLLPVLGRTAEAETEAGEDGEERSRAAKRREKEAAAGDPVERGCMAKAAGAAQGQTVRTTAADVVKAAAGGAARPEPVAAAAAAKDAETGAANAAAAEDTEAAASGTTAETTAVADAEAVAAEMAEREAARGKRRSTASGGTPVKKMRHCTGDCCEAPTRRAGAVEQPHQLAAGSAATSRKPGSTLPCLSAAVDGTVKPHASRCSCLTVDRMRKKSSSRWQPSVEDRQTAEVFVAAYLAAVNEELACSIFRLVDHLLSIADGQSYTKLPGSAAVVAAAAAVPPPAFPARSCLAVAAGGHTGTAADSDAAGDAAPPTTVTMAAGGGGSVAAAAGHDCDLAFPLSGCRKLTHSAAVIAAAAAAPALSPSLTPSRSSSSSVASPRPPAAAAAAPLQRPLLQTTQHREATPQLEPRTQQGEQQQQQTKDKGEEERQGEAEPDEIGLPKTPTKQSKCRSSVASWFSPATVRSPLAAASAAEDSPLSHSPPVQLRSPALAAERRAASAGDGRSSSSGDAAATDQAAGTHAETQLQALCGGCLLREEAGIETLLPHLSLPEHLILGAFTRLHEQRRLPKTLHLACEQLAQLFVNPHAKQQQPHIAGLRRAFTRLLERGVLRLCDVAAIHQTAAFAGVAAAAADGLFSSSFLCYVPCKFPAYSKYRQMLETLRLPGEFKAWVCSFEFCS